MQGGARVIGHPAVGIYQNGALEEARRRGIGQKMGLDRVTLTFHTI
jgi:hypothetical protein